MARRTVASVCKDFAAKAAKGEASFSVAPEHAASVALELVRLGFKVGAEVLDLVPDDEVRHLLKTVLFSAGGGALVGAGIGGLVAGALGAKVGAAVGTVVGCAVATTVMVRRGRGASGQARVVFATA